LRVTAPSLVVRFKGQSHDARQVGRELGVEAVLEGSVWRSGDRIRVTVNLVGVKDGFNLWAQRFDGNLADVFAVQDQVCAATAEALHLRLATRVTQSRPRNTTAYVQYLKGRHMMGRRRPNDVRRAFEYFQEAIRLDPGYAEPYVGAALYYIIGAVFGALPPRSALPQAEDLIAKGLALDADSVNLNAILGHLRTFQWRWAESEQTQRHAMSLEPANAYPHMVYPLLCSMLGRHEEAVAHAAKAVELDPLDLMTNFRLVQANYYARRYDEAIRTGRVAVELAPDSPYTFFYLALALAATGLNDEAWSVATRGNELNEGLPLGEGYFGYLAGVLGRTEKAHRILRELQARREKEYAPALPVAWTFLGVGEKDKASDWLESALAEREPFLGSLNVFPGYDTIRDQARFRRLARELQLPN
jgi:tetratricopeptide (TPR) repeat protein